MVALARPNPRRLIVTDDAGHRVAVVAQEPITGGFRFLAPDGERAVVTVTPADDGYCVLLFDRSGEPNVVVSVDNEGGTRIEAFDEMQGNPSEP